MSSETKVCTKCGIEKRLSSFSKHSKGKLGTRPRCKDCQSIDNRAAWLSKNPSAKPLGRRSGVKKTRAQIQKEYLKRNPHVLANKWKKSRQNMSGSYIRSLLGISGCYPELIELKREQLTIFRLAKQLKHEVQNV